MPAAPLAARYRERAERVRDEIRKYEPVELFLTVLTASAAYNSLLSLVSRRRFKPQLAASLRLAGLISLYSHCYRRLLRYLSSNRESSLYLLHPVLKSFLSSLAASPLLAFLPREQTLSTSFYLLAHAIRTLAPSVPPSLSSLPSIVVFGLSNSILLHAFLYNPDVFPKAYSGFILRYSRSYLPSSVSTKDLLPALRDLTSFAPTYPSFRPPFLNPSSPSLSIASERVPSLVPTLQMAHPMHSRMVCAMLHPSDPRCGNVAQKAMRQEFGKLLPFFAGLSALGVALNRKALVRNPEKTLYKALLATLSSSAFVSLAINTAWSTICLGQRVLPGSKWPTKRFYIQGFIAGLWIFLVDVGASAGTSRAADLAAYAARLALQMQWEILRSDRIKKNPKSQGKGFRVAEFGILAVSLSALMCLNEELPERIRSRFLKKGLNFVAEKKVGPENGKDEGESRQR